MTAFESYLEERFESCLMEEGATEGGYATGPERGLLAALLFDGTMAALDFLISEKRKRRSREAYEWVWTRGNDYVFSFDNVCEALGIHPEAMRLGISNLAMSRKGEWKRLRRG